ncbi:MAG: hypothetical protein ACKOCT_16155, partial [Alphaproteobacteria bacterium]
MKAPLRVAEGRGRFPSRGRHAPLARLARLVLLAALLGCDAPAPLDEVAAPMQVRSERIARLPKSYRKGSLASSRDQRRVAWVAQPEAKGPCRVVVDGVAGPERKACSSPTFSSDGARVGAWVTTVEAPGAATVSRLSVDSELVGPDLVDAGDLRFASEAPTWAASALLAPPTGGGAAEAPRMRVFGPAGDLGTFRDTTAPAIDARGEHVAWVASDADGRHALFVDGKEVRDFGVPPPISLGLVRVARPGPNLAPEETVRWLPDGTLVGIAPSGLGWLVFRAAAPGSGEAPRDFSSHDVLWRTTRPPASDPALRVRGSALLSGSLATAERAAVACWWERPGGAGGLWRVACNGKPADDVTCPVAGSPPIAVAPSGDGVAYACTEASTKEGEDRTWVVARGRRFGPHFEVASIETADGGHFAYAARDSSEAPFFYVVDGRRVPGEWDEVFAPRFSRDGRHVAWGARPDAKQPRIDLVLDGRVRTRADMVAAPPRVEDEGSASWVVRRGKNVLRVAMTRGARDRTEPARRSPDAA